MFKPRMTASRPDRLAKLDIERSKAETSCTDETPTVELEGLLDDSPTDEMEVIPAGKDD